MRALALFVALGAAGCFDFEGLDDRFHPDLGVGPAGADLAACQPATTCGPKRTCGTIPDGCGGVLACGGCFGTCVENVCRCPGGRLGLDRLVIDVDPGPDGVYHCYAPHSEVAAPVPFPCEGFLQHEAGQDNAFYVYPPSPAPPTGGGLVPLYSCTNHNYRHFLSTRPDCADVNNTANEGLVGYIATLPICGAVPVTRVVESTDYDRMCLTRQGEIDAALTPGDGGGTPYVSEGVIGYVWPTAD